MTSLEYLAAAYILIWLLMAYYFFKSGTKVKKLEEKVKILEDNKDI